MPQPASVRNGAIAYAITTARAPPHARPRDSNGTTTAAAGGTGMSCGVRYADIVTGREQAGRPIGVADAQIAAICRDLSATLATRHIDDFEQTSVQLISPWEIA